MPNYLPFYAARPASHGQGSPRPTTGEALRTLLGALAFAILTTGIIAGWPITASASKASVGTASSATGQASNPAGVTILAAGDLRGEIKPCGCSPEGQMGGLARRMSYLAGQPAEGPVVVDLGNNAPEPSAQGDLKVALINNLLGQPLPDAMLPGPHELATGGRALPREFPWIVSNAAPGSPFASYGTIHRPKLPPGPGTGKATSHSIGLFGFLSPSLVYQGPQTTLRLEALTPMLLARWRKLIQQQEHNLTTLLFRGSDEELAQLTASGLFRVIISGNPSSDELKQITTRAAVGREGRITQWPQIPTKGQGFLRITVPRDDMEALRWEVDWLKDNYPDHPVAVPAFESYDNDVKALFFARLETMDKQQRTSPYAGADTCAPCHAQEMQIWQGSRHAGALGTLGRVGKQFDPECLACHVAGLGKGGFLSEDLTPKLGGVQCENCHGPARAHVAQPTMPTGPSPGMENKQRGGTLAGTPPPKPTEATCRTCHVGSHSPNFDFSVYWPKVRHGKTRY